MELKEYEQQHPVTINRDASLIIRRLYDEYKITDNEFNIVETALANNFAFNMIKFRNDLMPFIKVNVLTKYDTNANIKKAQALTWIQQNRELAMTVLGCSYATIRRICVGERALEEDEINKISSHLINI